MYYAVILTVVGLVSLHIASYGWYAWKEEKNLRGALGAFFTAGLTFAAPVALIIYYAYFVDKVNG
ncbi:hypothetical protein SAMN05660649_02594 [Desulfotomaculum arcticum]|uniref:Uncharacterized protein n=1 Tax=Desulfotruncus arcticus DSM 17038 TaxID=1121424 RepID=A0A1I2UM28_9FIRM|nr:hypothetical protein [Desulfotruncus arcticus]SFG75916.1 hypothetical protein SAMN05660649_02594 [Desulfotomaculum arcticum] [Desulfotruncus arcticus DSM 17038]